MVRQCLQEILLDDVAVLVLNLDDRSCSVVALVDREKGRWRPLIGQSAQNDDIKLINIFVVYRASPSLLIRIYSLLI